ncbi:hypothetical protein VNI00_017997 [Paramarasmius palmivorus]|uniref:Transposase n=1 Tax=Paramarasmius palmivorus TaxID=297713 RepID=A0AAW0B379_9AGAR
MSARPEQVCTCSKCKGKPVSYNLWSRHRNRRRSEGHLAFSNFAEQSQPAASGSGQYSSEEDADEEPEEDERNEWREGGDNDIAGESGFDMNVDEGVVMNRPNVTEQEDIFREDEDMNVDYGPEDRLEDNQNIVVQNHLPHIRPTSPVIPPSGLDDPSAASNEEDEVDLPEDPNSQQALEREERAEELHDLEQRRQQHQQESVDEFVPQPQAPDPPPYSTIETVRITQQLIDAVKSATLDDGHCPAHVVERLRNPIEEEVDISDPSVRHAIDLYLATTNASEQTYHDAREAYLRRHPEESLMSLKQVKGLVEEITGVVAVSDDMCVNGCHAFTGPFADLDHCSRCSEPRYDQEYEALTGKKRARLQFDTILLGPQLQARMRNPETALELRYRSWKVEQVHEALEKLEDELAAEFVYDDHACGEDFLAMVERFNLTEDDHIVTISTDSFQLYKNKKSDTYIGVWILEDYSPGERVRKVNIIPAFNIPGPNKIKNLDSYLLTSLRHVSALQKENDGRGYREWRASERRVVYSRPAVGFTTADRIGLAEMDGRVGHHGTIACRGDCPMRGRHKPDSGHYFSAHYCTADFLAGCMHNDFDFDNIQPPSLERYEKRLQTVSDSPNEAQYLINRRETGISKPCIFSGLSLAIPPPLSFVPDMMHLLLNLGQLLISIWRGTIDCAETDNKTAWPWRTLIGDTWKTHGAAIANATPYFPSFFHRPPRNPAQKINSGYKVTEYVLYVFCLGPGHFRQILPEIYYTHFCRLVYALRILNKRSIQGKEIAAAQSQIITFVKDYENLYLPTTYRPTSHFCSRVGPAVYHTNLLLSEQIGDTTAECNQPSNPWANFSQRQLCPQLDKLAFKKMILPRGAFKLGDSYVLLRKRERYFTTLEGSVGDLVAAVINTRSLWQESRTSRKSVRVTRNVKFKDQELDVSSTVKFNFIFFTRSAEVHKIPLRPMLWFLSTHDPINTFSTKHMVYCGHVNTWETPISQGH